MLLYQGNNLDNMLKCACLGVINMSQVLQRQMEQELELVDSKAGGVVLGKVNIFYSIIF